MLHGTLVNIDRYVAWYTRGFPLLKLKREKNHLQALLLQSYLFRFLESRIATKNQRSANTQVEQKQHQHKYTNNETK